jgi:hypothetical protein
VSTLPPAGIVPPRASRGRPDSVHRPDSEPRRLRQNPPTPRRLAAEPTEALVRELADDGESFSAAVTRLIEAGARSLQGAKRPANVAAGEGPEDLAARAADYLRAPVTTA